MKNELEDDVEQLKQYKKDIKKYGAAHLRPQHPNPIEIKKKPRKTFKEFKSELISTTLSNSNEG